MTNIIFSNGDLDPWHSGGVLYNITSSNKDIFTTLYIPLSAHHLDLRAPNAADPDVVTQARQVEANVIGGWIAEYYAISA